MDLNKIFNIFTPNLEDNQIETYSYDDIIESPVYWVGMFKKLIANHNNFNHNITQFLTKTNQELSLYDVETAGEFIVYMRAWYWISKFDITCKEHQITFINHCDEHLITYLKFSISFWEDYEEYEKCAYLKAILDFCENL